MDTNETETTTPATETGETEVSTDSPEEQETSNTSEEPEEKAETPEKEEKPSKDKPKEESFEEKVNRLAKSLADKSNKTYQQNQENDRKRIRELEKENAELTFKRANESLYEDEVESKGEDAALKNKAAREKANKLFLEYKDNAEQVNKVKALIGDIEIEPLLKALNKPTLKEAVNLLSVNARDIQAQRDVWNLVFPEDKEKIAKVNKYIEKFKDAHDQEDYEIILEGIRSEVRGKREKQTFDSGKQGGKSVMTTFTRSQLEQGGRAFWEEHKDEILKAQKEGKILDK